MLVIDDIFTLHSGLFEIKREGDKDKNKNEIRLIQATHLSAYPYLFSNSPIDLRIVPVKKIPTGLEKGNVLLGAIRYPSKQAISPVSLISEDMPGAYPLHSIIIFQLKPDIDYRFPYLLFWQLKYRNLLIEYYKGLQNKGSLSIKNLKKLPLPYADNPEKIEQVTQTILRIAKAKKEEEDLLQNLK